MFQVHKSINLKRATDAATGDVQVFLEKLLVEVIAANYRHFLSEITERTRNGDQNAEYNCWPPLFANERQVSGIFASALNMMCPSTLAEHKIHRDLEKADKESELLGKSGRVDFMCPFGSRYIGLELKRTQIGTTEAGDYTVLKQKWVDVLQQSKEVHTYMRQKEMKKEYPDGTGVGLMVIRVSKQVSSKWDIATEINRVSNVTQKISDEILNHLKPDFFASYIPPSEMQAVGGFGTKNDSYKIFPTILFAATVHGRAASLKR